MGYAGEFHAILARSGGADDDNSPPPFDTVPNLFITCPALVTALAIGASGSIGPGPADLVLHDAYSLRRAGLDALLLDHHYRTKDRSIPWAGTWPTPVLAQQIATMDTSARLMYEDTAGDRRVLIHPQIGAGYRNGLVRPTASSSSARTSPSAWTAEGGGIIQARIGDLNLWGDSRVSVERQEPAPHSYDGQFIEPSEEGNNSIASFTSFARFEGRMTLDTRLGRFGAGRHRQHWGPSYQYPLVLGQWTQPYSHVDWAMEFGAFRIRTLWAQLAVDGAGRFRSDTASRSLYAHRYEWSPTQWMDLGISEALILYKTQEPIAFVPILPLFMMKGQSVEGYANGELAFDAQIRPSDRWRIYGEFLIDDMSEPTQLFNDFWKNKWAVTLGSHLAFNPVSQLETGLITEASRVEPWVYTQYFANTNQATHQEVPLGNGNGPNSLSATVQAYARYQGLAIHSTAEWISKGVDSGSGLNDVQPESSLAKKIFLAKHQDVLVLRCRLSYARSHSNAWIDFGWSSTQAETFSVRQPAEILVGGMLWL